MQIRKSQFRWATSMLCSLFVAPALADTYPVSGSWGYIDPNEPGADQRVCESFRRTSDPEKIVKEGALVLFKGNERTDYEAGYLDMWEYTNLSVKRLNDNSFLVTDRFYQDEEGGAKRGWRRKSYRLLIVDDKTIEIRDNTKNSRYVSCASMNPPLPQREAVGASSATLVPPGTGKRDILGFYPGMTYEQSLQALASVTHISTGSNQNPKCDDLRLPADIAARNARDGSDQSCSIKEGFLRITFSKNIAPKVATSVTLDFPSGASPKEMIENISKQFGGQARDTTPMTNCDAMQNDGLGRFVRAYSKSNGEYAQCLEDRKRDQYSKVSWIVSGDLEIQLERQDHSYLVSRGGQTESIQSPGFKLRLTSSKVNQDEINAAQEALRNLNPRPTFVLTSSRNDILGVSLGMPYDDAVRLLNSKSIGLSPGECRDRQERLASAGYPVFECVIRNGIFNLQGTLNMSPKIVRRVDFFFETVTSPAELAQTLSAQFGAAPLNRNSKETIWGLPNDVTAHLSQSQFQGTGRSFTLSLDGGRIDELDQRTKEESIRQLNPRPKF